MPEIINNQRKVKIKKVDFLPFTETAADKIRETNNQNFTVVFVSNRKMRELNRKFRGKDSTTDVLSFPFEPDEFENNREQTDVASGYLGDILISTEQAEMQAAENNLDFETEVKQLILHGILHLCGYDHETDDGEMNRRELELRKILKI